MNIFIPTLILVGISILLMGIRVFFTKKGEFPSSHVEAQPELRKQGLYCHRSQDKIERRHKNLYDRIGEEREA